MKKNQIIVLISTLLYSILFYRQGFGANFFVFSACLIAFLAIEKPQLLQSRKWLFAASIAFISSLSMILHGNYLGFWATIVSLSVLSGLSYDPLQTIAVSLFNAGFSYFTAGINMILEMIFARKSDSQASPIARNTRYIVISILSILITSFFVMLYASANQLFKDFINRINLDFISFSWLIFTFVGFLLVLGFFYHRQHKALTDVDHNSGDELTLQEDLKNDFFSELISFENEAFLSIILLSLLNLVILVVNILDSGLLLNKAMVQSSSLCELVHNGVDTLIFSILCAMALILVFFRSRLNFHKNILPIKILAAAWMAQNAYLVFTTLCKNYLYISEYQLTYRRIGVYFYLGMTLIGLITILIKIFRKKSNWYLIRKNSWAALLILCVSSLINWDGLITSYNIADQRANRHPASMEDLMDLPANNLPELIQYALSDSLIEEGSLRLSYLRSHPTDAPDATLQTIPYRELYEYFLNQKIDEYTRGEIGYDPRSWTFDKARINSSIQLYEQRKRNTIR